MRDVTPVIDIFAGPGGLGEGFASYRPPGRKQRCFRILLSIEKEEYAHRTLELRSFYRQFVRSEVPEEYYKYLRGEDGMTREVLFNAYPEQARAARCEARRAELGKQNAEVDRHIIQALRHFEGRNWVLIGGPPCQAYSTIGRARLRAAYAKKAKDFEEDDRHYLYREYLRILARYRPSIFVMENVKGMLSSKNEDQNIFDKILEDLKNPSAVEEGGIENSPQYTIYSLVVRKDPGDLVPTDFVIKSEDFGVPQARHRVILLGVRNDIGAVLRYYWRKEGVGDGKCRT